ncbi:MAG TPA: ATP-dependent RecD-like DNA helicase, partial [Firmicutes bacterium]|nr:ATP-dependent RecD-like DNA helicase [Bacillota bacterium]
KYLSSGAVKGIGAATAARIVETFGENSLEVIEKEPERLAQVKGVTKSKAKRISEDFQQANGIKDVMARLGKYGITPEESVRIWKRYGAHAEECIRQDPFCLCDEELDIDFARADTIAASLEMPQDDSGRIRAGILHVLRHNADNGHTCLPRDRLAQVAARMLQVEVESVGGTLRSMEETFDVQAQTFGEREFIFLPRYYQSETYSADRLKMMLRYPPQSIVGVEGAIKEVEIRENIHYAAEQKEAIVQALEKGFLILTGGPGTGKTTTLNGIIRILKNKGETVLLAAPTGRAAKRMSELTGEEAKTVHRLLQVEWDDQDNPVFSRNERNPLECDAVVVDELSMVDTLLFEGILRALPLGCRLILVGDCDQLPSVGAGNVLGDLIASGMFPVVQLTEIFRQSMESLIVTNAHRIVAGQMPELRDKAHDFFFLPLRRAESISNTIVDLCARRLPASYGYSVFQDIQVLAPSRKGELGTIELNHRLQEALNPPEKGKKELSIGGSILREGDKVMQVKNNYNLPWTRSDGTTGEGVFNGDVGILVEIDKAAGALTVAIDDKMVLYDTDHANELELAYAATVHKSQGNEFQAVILPMFPGPKQLQYRNLLYTAVTRAKSLLILVGEEGTIQKMVANDRKTRRYSGLLRFLLAKEEPSA